jgi:hypothetical protein
MALRKEILVTDLTTNGLQIDLASTGARFTPVALRLPEDMPKADWVHVGQKLLRADQVMQWWIGDWAQFGAGNPDKEGWRKKGALIEFCKANRVDYSNVRNKSYVSGAVHLSLRRDNVRWSFFQEIAPLRPREQKEWLEKAVSQELTVSNLRQQIRISKGEQNALLSDGPRIEFGTQYFEELMGWLVKRPPEFWTVARKEIWEERIMKMAKFVGSVVCHDT